MIKKIVLQDTEARKKICQALNISNALLSMSLSFKRNSAVCSQARKMALENGGVLMEEKPMSRTVRILNARGETIKTMEK